MLKVKSPMATSLLRVGWAAGPSIVDEYLEPANKPAVQLQIIWVKIISFVSYNGWLRSSFRTPAPTFFSKGAAASLAAFTFEIARG